MRETRVARLWRSLAALGVVGAVVTTLATVSVAGPVAAASPQTATCSFNGVPSGGLATGITPGSTINVSCSGLPDVTELVIAQGSELAALLPSNEEIDERDTADLEVGSSSSTGTLNTSFTVPRNVRSGGPECTVSPNETEQNAGLIGCTVSVQELAGTNYGSVSSSIRGKPGRNHRHSRCLRQARCPARPSPCPEVPVRDRTAKWWGNSASFQTITDSEITLGGVAVPSDVASVAPASYSITISKAGKVTPGPLHAPVLFGTFTVPCDTGTKTVSVTEANMTPLAGTISATAPLTLPSGKVSTVTGLSPDRGGKKGGTSVTISGCKFSHVTAVDFGATPAKSFHVDNSHSIIAVSPPGTGVVNVIVHTVRRQLCLCRLPIHVRTFVVLGVISHRFREGRR